VNATATSLTLVRRFRASRNAAARHERGWGEASKRLGSLLRATCHRSRQAMNAG
jgi:hypothetical protein